MSSEFKKIYELKKNGYDKSVEIIIEAGQLLFDNESKRIFVLLKFRNVAKNALKAIKIVINALDSELNLVEEKEYTYLDLKIGENKEFGNKTPIFLSDNTTKYRINSFTVSVIETVTTTNTIKKSDGGIIYLSKPMELSKCLGDEKLLEEYKLSVCNKAQYVPHEEQDLWLCTCGAYNHHDEKNCSACNSSLEKQLKALNKEELYKRAKQRAISEDYKQACQLRDKNTCSSVKNAIGIFTKLGDYKDCSEQLSKCNILLQKLIQQQNEKAKKNKIIIILASIAACVAIVITVSAVSVSSHNKKIEKYNTAQEYLSNGDIEAAYELFVELGNFNDSKDYVEKYQEEYKAIKYYLDFTTNESGNYTVSLKYENCEVVTIPSNFLGKPVTQIGRFSSTNLTSVVIPDSVTSIGDLAFESCSGLTSVVIPDSVTSIGGSAFRGCSGLTSVVIGNSVTSIGDDAFEDCSSLQYNEYDNAYYLGNENNPYLVLIKAKDTSISSCIINNQTKVIYSEAFEDCSLLTSVVISNSVTSIGDGAFYNCSGLKGVYISDIAAWCKIDFYSSNSNPLYYAHNLYLNNELVTNLVIPDSVTSIGDYAFEDCSGLTSVVIPDSVTSIGNSAFSGCSSLQYNEYDNAYYLGNENNPYLVLIEAKDSSIDSCNINSNTKLIGDYAFYFCYGLTSVVIGNSVTSIGKYAFYECGGLTSVVIPNSVTLIGRYAFSNCSGLTSVVIPDSVTSIGNSAFYQCGGLTSVVIPNSVTSIGDYAFCWCGGLTSVVIGNSVTSIGSSAFNRCSGLTSVVIPDSVTSIGDYAFYECSGLTSVVIPDSVTSIGDYAYACSGLTSVVIPNSVTRIGDYAFSGYSGFTKVYYNGTANDWNNISIGGDNSYSTRVTRYYYSKTQPTDNGEYWHYDENGNVVEW